MIKDGWEEVIMSDVLSQEEIDKLLKAFNSGELDADEFKDSGEKQVKDYDFSRPSKFSKEHLRTLEIVFALLPVVVHPPACILTSDRTGGGSQLRSSYLLGIFQCIVKSGITGHDRFRTIGW